MQRFPGPVIRTIILALMLAAIAACSSTANALPTAVAGADGSSQPGADPSGALPSGALPSGDLTDPTVAWPAFAACLRAHGLNIADPEVDQGGNPQWGDDLKKYITEPIRTACTPIIDAIDEGGTLKGGLRNGRSYTLESEIAHAACMRGHGLPDFPDPDPDGNGGMPTGFDKADPTVFAALVACEPVLVQSTASPSPAL